MNGFPITDDDLKELRDAFALFDQDGDGGITKREMRAVMAGFGYELDREILNPLFRSADANRDGRLQWLEFVNLVQKLDADDDEHRALHESLMVFLDIRRRS